MDSISSKQAGTTNEDVPFTCSRHPEFHQYPSLFPSTFSFYLSRLPFIDQPDHLKSQHASIYCLLGIGHTPSSLHPSPAGTAAADTAAAGAVAAAAAAAFAFVVRGWLVDAW